MTAAHSRNFQRINEKKRAKSKLKDQSRGDFKKGKTGGKKSSGQKRIERLKRKYDEERFG